MISILFILTGVLIIHICADIPVHCNPVDDMVGTWTLYVGPVVDRKYNCSSLDIFKTIFTENVTVDLKIEADKSHVVYVNNSVAGRWTGMDVEGFDLFIDQNHWQAYFNFTEDFNPDTNETCYSSNCSQTLGGWVRKDVIHPDEFRCFYGLKSNNSNHPCNVFVREEEEMYHDGRRVFSSRYIKPSVVEPAEFTKSRSEKNTTLPDAIDWTNYTGINYVDPVYDQSRCGSCFSFAALSALESRLFITSNRSVDVSLSQQDIVSCSHYSQGCDGGFGPEVGFWAKDHGVVVAKCLPYVQYRPSPSRAVQPACSVKCPVEDGTTANTHRVAYASNVSYVGGFFGACSAELMQEALLEGPISVSINASPEEFRNASAGDIVSSNSTGNTNHAVLLVGYGVDGDVPFWKIKNSWGVEWGEKGYIRIYRGNNTLRIESKAVVIYPGSYTYVPPTNPPSAKSTNKLTSTEKVFLVCTVALAVALIAAVIAATVLAIRTWRKPKTAEVNYSKYKNENEKE